MDLMQVYNSSPIFVQNIMTSAQGLIYKRERYGKYYQAALKEYLSRDYSDSKFIEDYQWERFAELLRYAVERSPFYQEYYRNIDIESVISSHDITKLPILEKETVRKNIKTMYTISEDAGIESNTSGTTGTSMRFLYTIEDNQRRMAYLDAFKIKHGFVPMVMKRASFNSAKIVPPNKQTTVFWRDNLPIKQRIYSGYFCKGENVKYYVENLNKYQPQSLDGYPSAMYELARYVLDNKIELNFRPCAIFPTAETLLPHYKTAIEEAFRSPVYDQYASSEGAPFIVECKSRKLHYCKDTGIIEFMDDGEMVVTCFESHGTPLIRYKIGDKAFLSENQNCDCGSSLPIVDRIEGRTMDYLLSPKNGKFTSIYMSLVSSEFANCMKAMQFVQNEITAVDVYLEVDDKYDISMNKIIEDKLHYSLGASMNIRIHVVDEIKKEASGKFRLIINNLRV